MSEQFDQNGFENGSDMWQETPYRSQYYTR